LYKHAFLAISLTACAAPPETPRTGERRIIATNSPKSAADGYLFAVRSHLSSLGLLRADGFDRQAAESFAKTMAQALEACVTREFSRGALQAGATQVDVSIDKTGRIAHINLTSEPPTAHAGALLCLVPPLHAIHFGKGGERTVVLEALWGATRRP
jgi:hypothetical protein